MKIASDFTKTDVVSTGGKTVDMTVADNSGGMLFVILSEGLYSDPISSLVRELTTNAIDAHIEKGNVNVPVTVGIGKDDTEQYYFYVQDRGVGMDTETLETVYSKYMASTKRESNEQHGYFGLGSKSPLAYTDVFYIATVHNGVENVCTMSKGESSTQFSFVRERKTSNPSGTRIWFYIDTDDYDKFVEAMRAQLGFFDNVIFEGVPLPNDFKIWKNGAMCHSTLNNMSGIVLGNVWYPDRKKLIPDELFNQGICIYCPIGSVMVTPSREDIRYTDTGEAFIKQQIKQALDDYTKEVLNAQTVLSLPNYDPTQSPDYNAAQFEMKSVSLYGGKFIHEMEDNMAAGSAIVFANTNYKATPVYTSIMMLVCYVSYMAKSIIEAVSSRPDFTDSYDDVPTEFHVSYDKENIEATPIPDELINKLVKMVINAFDHNKQHISRSYHNNPLFISADDYINRDGSLRLDALIDSKHLVDNVVPAMLSLIFEHVTKGDAEMARQFLEKYTDKYFNHLSSITAPKPTIRGFADAVASLLNKKSLLYSYGYKYPSTLMCPGSKLEAGGRQVQITVEYMQYKAYRTLDGDGTPYPSLASILHYAPCNQTSGIRRYERNSSNVPPFRCIINILSNISTHSANYTAYATQRYPLRIAYLDAVMDKCDLKGRWMHSRIISYFDAGHKHNGKDLSYYKEIILIDRKLVPSFEYTVALHVLTAGHPHVIVDVTDEVVDLVNTARNTKLPSKPKSVPSTVATTNTTIQQKSGARVKSNVDAITGTGYQIIRAAYGHVSPASTYYVTALLATKPVDHTIAWSPSACTLNRDTGIQPLNPGTICISYDEFMGNTLDSSCDKNRNLEYVRGFIFGLHSVTDLSRARKPELATFKQVRVIGSKATMQAVFNRQDLAYVTVHDFFFGNEKRRTRLLQYWYTKPLMRYIACIIKPNAKINHTFAPDVSCSNLNTLDTLIYNLVYADLDTNMPDIAKLYSRPHDLPNSSEFDCYWGVMRLLFNINMYEPEIISCWMEHYIPYPIDNPGTFDAYYSVCYDMGYDLTSVVSRQEASHALPRSKSMNWVEYVLRDVNHLSADSRLKMRKAGFGSGLSPRVYSKYFYVEPTHCIG